MALTVTGLTKDFYLSNNPIFVNIEETSLHSFFTIKIGDYTASIITPIANKASVDISSYVKSLYPQSFKIVRLQIIVSSYRRVGNSDQLVNSYNVTKHFIRGGRRGSQTNTTVQPDGILKVTERLPYWAGYFSTYDALANVGGNWQIIGILLSTDNPLAERRKIKGCNPTYVRFLNSLGGYSFWMFEGIEDQQKNTNEGLINNTRMIDLGNSFDQEVELFSKVPKPYIALIQDLIISPEIYIYRLAEEGVVWDRYYSSNNTLEVNPAKNAQSVKIKLKPFNKFNPQLIWQ